MSCQGSGAECVFQYISVLTTVQSGQYTAHWLGDARALHAVRMCHVRMCSQHARLAQVCEARTATGVRGEARKRVCEARNKQFGERSILLWMACGWRWRRRLFICVWVGGRGEGLSCHVWEFFVGARQGKGLPLTTTHSLSVNSDLNY